MNILDMSTETVRYKQKPGETEVTIVACRADVTTFLFEKDETDTPWALKFIPSIPSEKFLIVDGVKPVLSQIPGSLNALVINMIRNLYIITAFLPDLKELKNV